MRQVTGVTTISLIMSVVVSLLCGFFFLRGIGVLPFFAGVEEAHLTLPPWLTSATDESATPPSLLLLRYSSFATPPSLLFLRYSSIVEVSRLQFCVSIVSSHLPSEIP